VRIEASGFSSTVIRAVVSSRVAGRSRWSPVRGGKVAVISGGMVRTVDDYEFRSGSLVEYRIEGYATQEGEPAVIVQQRLVRVGPTERQVWIKFIASPYLNTRVELTDWSAVSRRARIALYDVSNRRDRVAVTDVHTGREFSIEVVVHTLAARDTLDEALGKGAPIFLQTPDTIACPTMYAAVGDFQWARPAPRSLRSLVTIQLYEVAPPPPSVVGTGMTYAVLAEQYGAYGDIGDTHDTYGDVAS
jgi:hypothetical protein